MITDKEIQEMLNKVQHGCRTRLLDVGNVRGAISLAADFIAAHSIPSPALKNIGFEYSPHSVAKAYGYAAEGTILTVLYGGDGDVKEIRLSRGYVNYAARSRLFVRASWDKLFEEAGLGEFDKAVAKSWGFSVGHGTAQIK